jgi:hypothetical protein
MNNLLETAFHEAGHALLHVLHGSALNTVTVRPGERGRGHWKGNYLGYCSYSRSSSLAEDRVQECFAGAIAGMIGMQPGWSPPVGWTPSAVRGTRMDMEMASRALMDAAEGVSRGSVLIKPEEIESLTARMVAETYGVLMKPDNLRALHVLAIVLYWCEWLRGPVAEMILKDALNLAVYTYDVAIPDIPHAGWQAIMQLGGYYSLQAQAWRVPPREWWSAMKIRDRYVKPILRPQASPRTGGLLVAGRTSGTASPVCRP